MLHFLHFSNYIWILCFFENEAYPFTYIQTGALLYFCIDRCVFLNIYYVDIMMLSTNVDNLYMRSFAEQRLIFLDTDKYLFWWTFFLLILLTLILQDLYFLFLFYDSLGFFFLINFSASSYFICTIYVDAITDLFFFCFCFWIFC